MIPSGQNLLEFAVSSFCKREVDMLRYVEHMDLFCLDLLDDFPQEAEEMFRNIRICRLSVRKRYRIRSGRS